jgi:hypothetical protein
MIVNDYYKAVIDLPGFVQAVLENVRAIAGGEGDHINSLYLA